MVLTGTDSLTWTGHEVPELHLFCFSYLKYSSYVLNMAAEKKVNETNTDLGLLEEDDEFEEFPAEG